jgi:hypothetical protein
MSWAAVPASGRAQTCSHECSNAGSQLAMELVPLHTHVVGTAWDLVQGRVQRLRSSFSISSQPTAILQHCDLLAMKQFSHILTIPLSVALQFSWC